MTTVLPNGFLYQPDLLTGDEETLLLEHIGALPFAPVEFRGFVAKRRAGSVIGWHRDAPKFGPTVLGVSLGSTARLRFKHTREDGRVERATILLEPRSAYAMKGDARAKWQHSIPAVDALRYSITFRSVRDDTGMA